MSWLLNFYSSTLGKKAVMAITGIILFGFVLVHMIGNLKLYFGMHAGRYALDVYGEWLRGIGVPGLPEGGALWIARIVLLAAVIFHIDSAVRLTLANRRARPVDYETRRTVAGKYAARTMRWGGVIIALFVVFHILDLTTGQVNPAFEEGAVHQNLIASLSRPLVSAFYILANLALGLHLYHGLWSMFQSLGLNHRKFNDWRRVFAIAFAVIVTIGNLSFPLAVLMGVAK